MTWRAEKKTHHVNTQDRLTVIAGEQEISMSRLVTQMVRRGKAFKHFVLLQQNSPCA